MIVDIYAEKKKRGRKKKTDTIPAMQTEPHSPPKVAEDFQIFNNSILTKREKLRMEKYGIIGYESVVDIFNNICHSKNLPNLTIYGAPGSGKSYLVNWLLAKLFRNHFKERVLYMSLNDERGISTMREKIKAFSNIQVKENSEIPSFKVIVFDQAEYISLDAQNALRRIIELSNNISRFIFITRNTRCIIDPILSRCLQLNLNTNAQTVRIQKYCEFFPRIPKRDIENICEMYVNFGREISILETITNLTAEEVNRFGIKEKIISDDECEIFMKIFEDPDSTIDNFINFISCFLKNINIIISLQKIYMTLRRKYGRESFFQKISEEFLNFELSANNDATENIFLLNLLLKCQKLFRKKND